MYINFLNGFCTNFKGITVAILKTAIVIVNATFFRVSVVAAILWVVDIVSFCKSP